MVGPQVIDHALDVEDDLPFEQFLTYRILSLTSRLNRQAIHILDEACGLRLPEWRCMAMIGRHDRLNLASISEIAGMDRGQVTRAIQGLVEKDYVSTERRAHDRRTVWARLTRSGQQLYDHTFPIMQDRQRRLLSALSPSDRKAFYRIMERLTDSLEEWQDERVTDETS